MTDRATHPLNASVGHQCNIGVTSQLNHLGSGNTDRAIIGGKGLVELDHGTADAGLTLNNQHPVALIGKIQGGLHPADTSANNQRIVGVCFHGQTTPSRPALGEGNNQRFARAYYKKIQGTSMLLSCVPASLQAARLLSSLCNN